MSAVFIRLPRAAAVAAVLLAGLLTVLLPGPAAGGDQGWWSLQPLASPPVPDEASPWIRTPVDAFILRELRSRGLSPAPEADPRALIRRLAYDLHGLPPSPEEVQAFVEDPSDDAYDRLVDRLLASPRYGERWGRHWLDVVHYGETHGYDKDKRRPNAWPYRDYVIRSFNGDKPYPRFVEEQLAGDVLYPGDPDGIVGLGFIAAGPWDFVGHVELREGTVDKDIARSNDRDDMVATAASTFLSVTAHCARCHDHKFDPIPQEDYYGLQAVFAGIERADRPYDPDPAVFRERKALTAERGELQARKESLDRAASGVSSEELTRIDRALGELARELEPVGGGRAAVPTAAGAPGPRHGYHSAIEPVPEAVKWVQVELEASRPIDRILLIPAHVVYGGHPGPGFGFPPRFRVDLSEDRDFSSFRTVADHTAADFPFPGDFPVLFEAGGLPARYVRITATRLWRRTGDYIFALGELAVVSEPPVGTEGTVKNLARGAKVRSLDSIESPPGWGRDYLVDGSSERFAVPEAGEPLERVVGVASRGVRRRQLLAEREALAESALDPALRRERAEVAGRLGEVERRLKALPPPSLVYAAASRFTPSGAFTPPRRPRPIHVLQRGDVRRPGKAAAPGGLSCVAGLEPRFDLRNPEEEGARRAALARWITDPRNMLAWRSITNRIWLYHFGRGLVDTPNDFGRMGSPPSHPALLDWLSSWFIARGGSFKDLHRLLVRSAVYRQSSAGRDRSEEARFTGLDSENRWLWRANRRRLDAEEVRDAILQLGGALDLAMGGPSADHFRFQDDHSPVYDYAGFDPASPAGRRRSVYRSIVRSVPDPFMDCLDCADPSLLVPRRNTTLTALQALAMLHDPFMIGGASRLAARVRSEGAGAPRAFELALGRRPGPEEATILDGYAAKHGLENACLLILNSNEFLFID